MCYLGDFNGRIGDKQDFNSTIDDVTRRHAIDNTTNKYRDYLLDFLTDARCCTLNGRGDINNDNFTSISPHKGRSVVDYIIVPYDSIHTMSNFIVTTVTDCIEKLGICRSSRVKVPDHSLLSCTVRLSLYDQHQNVSSCRQRAQRTGMTTSSEPHEHLHRRYRVNLIPDTLFQNERCRRCLLPVITSLEANIRCQRDIDSTYEELVSALHGEMSSELEFKDYTPGVRVTKPTSSVPLFSEFFSIVKTTVSYWISHLYLAGVVAARLRWHLSNINVIQTI